MGNSERLAGNHAAAKIAWSLFCSNLPQYLLEHLHRLTA